MTGWNLINHLIEPILKTEPPFLGLKMSMFQGVRLGIQKYGDRKHFKGCINKCIQMTKPMILCSVTVNQKVTSLLLALLLWRQMKTKKSIVKHWKSWSFFPLPLSFPTTAGVGPFPRAKEVGVLLAKTTWRSSSGVDFTETLADTNSQFAPKNSTGPRRKCHLPKPLIFKGYSYYS